jgi:long-chain acyl-CoA synthetase
LAEHGFWTFAQRDPSPLALVDPDDNTWTRGELLAECNKIVHGLRALGLEHGDTVAICLPNCAEFYSVYLACLQAG